MSEQKTLELIQLTTEELSSLAAIPVGLPGLCPDDDDREDEEG